MQSLLVLFGFFFLAKFCNLLFEPVLTNLDSIIDRRSREIKITAKRFYEVREGTSKPTMASERLSGRKRENPVSLGL